MSGVKRTYFDLLEEEQDDEQGGEWPSFDEDTGNGCEPDTNRTEHTKEQTCPASTT